jgi:hypothetical protein
VDAFTRRSQGSDLERSPVREVPLGSRGGSAALIGLVALGSTAYGYLDAGERPTLELVAGMLLAGTAILGIVVPALPRDDASEGRDHRAASTLATCPSPLFLAAVCSVSAGVVHAAVIQQHFEDYWLYGVFFVLTTVVQASWALAIVLRPTKALLLVGLAFNLAVAAAWVVTRSYGTIVGPDAAKPASVGFGDLWSTIAEVAIVLSAVALLAAPTLLQPGDDHRREVVNEGLAIAVVFVTALALYSAVAGPPFVSHVG